MRLPGIRALAAISAGLGFLSCGDGARGGYVPLESAPAVVRAVLIETGAPLEAAPGQGPALLVESPAEGEWRISTACDTATKEPPCAWDLVVSIDPASDLGTFSPTPELESDDQVMRLDRGALRLVWNTGGDLDVLTLSAPSGAALALDVMLDSVPNRAVVTWVQSGAVHAGAPSNPVHFEPAAASVAP